jgi:hypothetical protein
VSTQPAPSESTQTPVETPFADAASPFKRTEAPTPVFPGPPQQPLHPPAQSTWITYRAQINLGLAMVAYLMVLVGSVIVIQANPSAGWRYYVAALPAVPGVVALFLLSRALWRLDAVQSQIQLRAIGLAAGATALVAFGYGFLEGAGLPHLSWGFVVLVMGAVWVLSTAFFAWRYR